jgi:hypothetical protein
MVAFGFNATSIKALQSRAQFSASVISLDFFQGYVLVSHMLDNLRDALFAANVIAWHNIKTAKQLEEWLHTFLCHILSFIYDSVAHD